MTEIMELRDYSNGGAQWYPENRTLYASLGSLELSEFPETVKVDALKEHQDSLGYRRLTFTDAIEHYDLNNEIYAVSYMCEEEMGDVSDIVLYITKDELTLY